MTNTAEYFSKEIIGRIGIFHGDITITRLIGNTRIEVMPTSGMIIYDQDIVSTSTDSSILFYIDGIAFTLGNLERFHFSIETIAQVNSIYWHASLHAGKNIFSFEKLERAITSGKNIENLLSKTAANDEAIESLGASASIFGNIIVIWPLTGSSLIPDTDAYHDTTQHIQHYNSENNSLIDSNIFINPAFANLATHVEDDHFTGREDTTQENLHILSNDQLSSQANIAWFDFASHHGGKVSLSSNNTFTYKPRENFHGVDTFRYAILDENEQLLTAIVTLNVEAVDDGSPSAKNDTQTLLEDSKPLFISVLSNDFLPDDAYLSNHDTRSENGGTVSRGSDQTLLYSPAENYNGHDYFEYQIKDSDGQIDTAIVNLNILAVTDGTPIASNDSLSSKEDQTTVINPLDNDTLIDQATLLQFDRVSTNGGTISVATPSSSTTSQLTYTPAQDYHGTDAFTYTIVDSDGERDTATVTLAVESVNDIPVNQLPNTSITVAQNGGALLSEHYQIHIHDADNNVNYAQLSVNNGTLSIGDISGLATTVMGNASSSIIISGTQLDINNTLTTLSYHPDDAFAGFDQLHITSRDSDNAEDSDNINIKVAIDAKPAYFTEPTNGAHYSTGLTGTKYLENSVYRIGQFPLSDSHSIESDIAEASDIESNASRMTHGIGSLVHERDPDSDNNDAPYQGPVLLESSEVYSLTGLIYLEANTNYTFSGDRDDALLIELGGNTLVRTTDNSSGRFSTRAGDDDTGLLIDESFTPEQSGFYTLEIYSANIIGGGGLAINVAIDNTDYLTLSTDQLSLYSNVDELIHAGELFDDFIINTEGTSDGGYFPTLSNIDAVGIAGQTIALRNLSVQSESLDTLISIIIDIPIGSTLSDGFGNSFTATTEHTSIDILTNNWQLNALALSAPDALPGEQLELMINASTQSVSLDTTETSSTFTIHLLSENGTLGIEEDIRHRQTDDELLLGSGFNDSLIADDESRIIIAYGGDDQITANHLDNVIYGGNGDDIIKGESGSDIIFGGQGNDTLTGHSQLSNSTNDEEKSTSRFVWLEDDIRELANNSTDVITDFISGTNNDILDLSRLLMGESHHNIQQFLELDGETLSIDINGDGSGYNDLHIQLQGLNEGSNDAISLNTLINQDNIIFDTERYTLQGTANRESLIGRDQNGETYDEDFFGNGGEDNIFGNGGADRFYFSSNDNLEAEDPSHFQTIRIQDLFTVGNIDSNDEADVLDFSELLQGANTDNITDYLEVSSNFYYGSRFLVDINGDNSTPDFQIHLKAGLNIAAELGFSDDSNQQEILQALINNGNIIIH